eukprot:SAG31_NODE_688_length_12807_cov_6.395814_2_plen_175_part_00
MEMSTSGTTAEQEAATKLEMISFHSISKGFLGECGIRGGYFELYNLDPAIKANLYKLASISLCSNTHGQVGVGLMVKPPAPGAPSYAQYEAEKKAIMDSLQRRAKIVGNALNKLEGVSCQDLEGAMYAFPSLVCLQTMVSDTTLLRCIPNQQLIDTESLVLDAIDHSRRCACRC